MSRNGAEVILVPHGLPLKPYSDTRADAWASELKSDEVRKQQEVGK